MLLFNTIKLIKKNIRLSQEAVVPNNGVFNLRVCNFSIGHYNIFVEKKTFSL